MQFELLIQLCPPGTNLPEIIFECLFLLVEFQQLLGTGFGSLFFMRNLFGDPISQLLTLQNLFAEVTLFTPGAALAAADAVEP